jgi:hypothetical protein
MTCSPALPPRLLRASSRQIKYFLLPPLLFYCCGRGPPPPPPDIASDGINPWMHDSDARVRVCVCVCLVVAYALMGCDDEPRLMQSPPWSHEVPEPSQPIQVSCRCSRSTNAVVKRFATSASAQHHVGVIYIYILFMISHSRFETKQNASPRYNSPRQPTPCSSRPHHRYRIQLPREIRKFGCKQFLHEAKFWLPPTPDDTSPPCALRALRNAVVCMTYVLNSLRARVCPHNAPGHMRAQIY